VFVLFEGGGCAWDGHCHTLQASQSPGTPLVTIAAMVVRCDERVSRGIQEMKNINKAKTGVGED
jgi:hypothetical protein